jgi:hypothetical protein
MNIGSDRRPVNLGDREPEPLGESASALEVNTRERHHELIPAIADGAPSRNVCPLYELT